MNNKIFENIESNISFINSLKKKLNGKILIDRTNIDSQVSVVENEYLLKINSIINLQSDETNFIFKNKKFELKIDASITSHKNSVNLPKKFAQQYSEGRIYEIKSIDFCNSDDNSIYRAYFSAKNSNIFYDCFEETIFKTETYNCRGLFELEINNQSFCLIHYDEYIIIESVKKIDYEFFSETCYNILVAIGFVTGKFYQNEVYLFKDLNKNFSNEFSYRKLRRSSFSIYHSITNNPYGYEHFIGNDLAERLYKSKKLKKINAKTFSKLIELIQNNSQIQYALVLFNEANGNNLSLLIKNNCYFVVLEVLRKFFHDIFVDNISNDYSRKGNTDKFVTIFEFITFITEYDKKLLKDRNLYLHGDIKDLEGKKMIDDMHKQITLIYRIILSYVGFNGFVINHFAIRNNEHQNAFLKCN